MLSASGDTRQAKIFTGIRELIANGALAPGVRLPSTRRLASDLDVSRGTVLAAIERLTADGWLETRHGSGTFVARELQIKSSSQSGGRLSQDHGAQAPFSVGVPGLDLFPSATWNRLQASRWRRMPRSALQEGERAGWAGLRNSIASHLHVTRGIRCEPEQIIVTNGARSAMYLALRVLALPGEQVLMEDPGYFGAKDAARAQGLTLVPVQVDAEGMQIASAEAIAPRAKLAVVTSHCQFPTGVPMSLARRQAFTRWVDRMGGWIIDNGYDSEITFDNARADSIASCGHERIIYVNSFNKSLFPALRIGYLVAPRRLVDRFAAARGILDGHSNVPNQMVLHDFLEGGHYDEHVRICREAYSERRDALMKALRGDLAAWLSVQPHQAGLHLTADTKGQVSAPRFVENALSDGIDVTSMTQLMETPDEERRVLLGFCAFSPTSLNAAATRLARSCARAFGTP